MASFTHRALPLLCMKGRAGTQVDTCIPCLFLRPVGPKSKDKVVNFKMTA